MTINDLTHKIIELTIQASSPDSAPSAMEVLRDILDDQFLYRNLDGVLYQKDKFLQSLADGKFRVCERFFRSTWSPYTEELSLIAFTTEGEMEFEDGFWRGVFDSVYVFRKAGNAWKWAGGQTSADSRKKLKISEKRQKPPEKKSLPAIPKKTFPVKVKQSSRGNSIYVGNLSYIVTEGTLLEVFSKYGTVVLVKIERDEQGRMRGFGFVQMQTSDEAAKAIKELDGVEVEGRAVVVELDSPELRKLYDL
ncbi:MAG: RNA recognition motif domain-containing protein [Bdellovibrionia bacterium]